MRLVVTPTERLSGRVRVPGDKSISHRALLLGALAQGVSHISGFLPSGDCHATLECIQALGIPVTIHDAATLSVHGRGLWGLRPAGGALDCVRSGTTMRLLAGLLAGQPFESILNGDQQLLRRPMRRVTDPLRRMGAAVEDVDGHGPLTLRGGQLRGAAHRLDVASAQVKSALLLAGLYADSPTSVHLPGPARDHTERMLAAMGAEIESTAVDTSIHPITGALTPLTMHVPGDLSSAAYILVATLLLPRSDVLVEDVGTNPTRTGLLDVLGSMGGEVQVERPGEEGGEPVADIRVRGSALHGVEVSGDTAVRMIDEFPILAVAATQAEGKTSVRDAQELRVKETDRIATVVTELRSLGACIDPTPDGFVVEGPTPLHGAVVSSHGDHRLGMALAVAGLVARNEIAIDHAECISDSFPGFVDVMQALGAQLNFA